MGGMIRVRKAWVRMRRAHTRIIQPTFEVEIISLRFHAPEIVLLVPNLDFQVLDFPLVVGAKTLACRLYSHGYFVRIDC